MVRMIDMFPEAVRKKLDFFNKDKYTIATEEVDLKEKKKYGEVCLKCELIKIHSSLWSQRRIRCHIWMRK